MTNREFLIQKLNFRLYSTNEIEEIFDLIHQRDYEYFCSQMGDYDHPEERIQADKVFDKEMKKSFSYII